MCTKGLVKHLQEATHRTKIKKEPISQRQKQTHKLYKQTKIKSVVKALIKPARLPFKSSKTYSRVLGIGCDIPSINTCVTKMGLRVLKRTRRRKVK